MHCCTEHTLSFLGSIFFIPAVIRFENSVQYNIGVCMGDCRNFFLVGVTGGLKWGNACYYSVQNLLSSSLLSKKLKIKIYRSIILPVVLYGCETWSLTLREERRLRVFENRVLRRVFGPKRDEVTGNGENYIMRSLVIFTPYPILCGW